MTTNEPLLELSGVDAAIEEFQVTHSIDLTVNPGEVVGYVGRNGAGKTTTYEAIMGFVDVLNGSIEFKGEDVTAIRPEIIPTRGIGYQPEDRGLFTGMTVEENFRLPIWSCGDARGITDEDAVIEDIFDIFDNLRERRHANVETLSGGQAKMAAIGRALALRPDLLILDEPLEGLAPVVVEELTEHLEEIMNQGISVLISESNMSNLVGIVDRVYIIERGEILHSGKPNELTNNSDIQKLMQG